MGFTNFQHSAQPWDLLARRVLVAAAACVAVLALWNIAPEFTARKAIVQGALGPYRGAAEDLAQPAASVEGVYDQFAVCDAALTQLITGLQPADQRAAVAAACLSLADTVLHSAPTLAFAHLIKAIALREVGQTGQARGALLLSEMTGGGNVQYAQRRAELWVDLHPALTTGEAAALQRDMVRLSNAPAGLTWLAGQYAKDPSLRPIITAAIESLPTAAQTAFLAAVRRISQ